VIHLFLQMARKADEAANFIFVQVIEQESGVFSNATQAMLGGT
jgi:hypothetical protein